MRTTVKACKEFINSTFEKIKKAGGKGIEINYFWRIAEESGLWKRNTYGSPMSRALQELMIDEKLSIEEAHDENGEYLYTSFRLK